MNPSSTNTGGNHNLRRKKMTTEEKAKLQNTLFAALISLVAVSSTIVAIVVHVPA